MGPTTTGSTRSRPPVRRPARGGPADDQALDRVEGLGWPFPMSSGRTIGRCVVAFLVAAVGALAFMELTEGRFPAAPSPDYVNFYAPVAANIADGRGIITSAGDPAVRFPPGYPLVLAGTRTLGRAVGMSDSGSVRALTVLGHGLAAALLLVIGHLLFSPAVGATASVLFATYPVGLYVVRQPPTSEIVFVPLLLLTVLAFVFAAKQPTPTTPRFLLAGLMMGLCGLVRPTALFLFVPFAFALALRFRRPPVTGPRRLAVLCLAMIAGNLVAIAPWEIWAKIRTGSVIPLSTGGPDSTVDGLTFAQGTGGPDEIDLPGPVSRIRTEARREQLAGGLEGFWPIARFVAGQAVDNPVGVLELGGLKAVQSWYASHSRELDGRIALIQVPYVLLIVVGVVLVLRSPDTARGLCWLPILLGGYFWLMTCLGLSIARLMLPGLALLLLVAAVALVAAAQVMSGRSQPRVR